nr:replication-relaxation family protein [Cognatishimia maritima]
MACHRPQSSQYLYELTRDTHRCKDTALRQMQKLRAGDFLRLPTQQRATEGAGFNPYIYDLKIAAEDHLYEAGELESTVRPTGHWWHSYATSCVTSSMDIAAARRGVAYIPAHQILAKRDASLAIKTNRWTLIPDQLFALNYGRSFRAFMLEVDRGTEPLRSIEQYAALIEQSGHQAHYGLKANMLILWVFQSQRRQDAFLDLLQAQSEKVQQSILSKTVRFEVLAKQPDASLFEQAWKRSGASSVSINS